MPERPRVIRSQSFIVPEIQNPFRSDLKLNVWDYIRIALMSVTIAPLRFVSSFIIFPLPWILCYLAVLGRSKEEKGQPLRGWRKALKWPVLVLARAQMFCMGFHWVKFKGRRATASEAPILVVAPHTSFFDAFVLFVTTFPSPVSRKENEETFFLGTLVKVLEPVNVSRKDPDSRQKTIAEIKKRVQPGGDWPQIIIFPEGTNSNGTCLITFKGGAFIPGVPIQPVTVRYLNRINTYSWTWDGPGAIACLWLTLCNLSNDMVLEFMPVYTPSAEEIANPRIFSSNVRAAMSKKLNIPVTDHTFEDCRLMEEAKAMGMPCEVGVVEFHKLLSKLGIKLEHLRSHLTKYSEIASSKGYITVEDLSKYLNVPVSPALQDIFDVYDRDGSGKIDFREYVIGCALVTQPANTEDTIRMAFEMFGGEKGYITSEDLFLILDDVFGMEREEADMLFREVDSLGEGHITYDNFKAYAEKKPEYAALFTHFMGRPDSEASSQPLPDDERIPQQTEESGTSSPRQRHDHSKKDD